MKWFGFMNELKYQHATTTFKAEVFPAENVSESTLSRQSASSRPARKNVIIHGKIL